MPEFVTIPALLNLHKIDRALAEAEQGLLNVTRDQKTVEVSMAQLKAELSRLQANSMQLQANIAAEELETAVKREHIEKMRTALNTTKTNKDYSAILVQISAEKAIVSDLEKNTFKMMEEKEALEKSIAALNEKIKGVAYHLSSVQAASAEKVRDLTTRIDAMRLSRTEAATRVPQEALKQYERIGQRHPGEVMAPVEYEEDDMENIACGGCFMNLSIEDVNLLRGRDEIRRCRSCGRILYVAQNPAAGERTAAN